MLNLEKHPYFKEYIDAKSGVKSYFLNKKVASLQQHFYFSECSLTEDEEYLWIRCINAPAQFIHLAVIGMNADNPSIKAFPQAGCMGGCPNIIPGTHDAIYSERDTVWRITPNGEMTKILSLPEEFLKNRTPSQVSTHLSISCDGVYVALDIEISDKWYMATGNMKTGEVKVLNNFARCYDHAQFSPVEPRLLLLDQDWWRDWHTGEYFSIDNRMWLMDINGTRFEPLIGSSWYWHDGTEYAHDFWSKDGKICWVDYKTGAYECDINEREVHHVWKRPMCHTNTLDRKLWCADETPYAWNERPCRVLFYDRKTNKEIDIFSALPKPSVERKGVYHLDPHPAFTLNGDYIISTVTLLDGAADVAITPVRELLTLCRQNGTIVE